MQCWTLVLRMILCSERNPLKIQSQLRLVGKCVFLRQIKVFTSPHSCFCIRRIETSLWPSQCTRHGRRVTILQQSNTLGVFSGMNRIRWSSTAVAVGYDHKPAPFVAITQRLCKKLSYLAVRKIMVPVSTGRSDVLNNVLCFHRSF
jgi:hypothetical protein